VPAPVSLVTVHHEGAGAPTDDPARYAHGGYTYGLGPTRWSHLRDVWSSYATLNFNHVSLDLCLSGNRMEYDVTPGDVDVIRGAVADARARGYVVDAPTVRAHRDSPGSSTVCPGDRTMRVWADVVAACQAGAAPTPPAPEPSEVVPLTCVASPQRANPAGRTPTARPVPALGAILLENGAALRGDAASGANRVWVSSDAAVKAAGNKLLDIAPTIGADGRPDGRGVVALFDLGSNQVGTYLVEWS
jgi:hypothetical protein